MMRGVFESVTRPLRELAWKIDEKVVWPLVDTVEELQYRFLGDGVPAPSPPMPRWRRYGPDLLVAGVLVVVAFLARRHGLPTDGLWLDDADPGAAVKASLSQLPIVGEDHPGFIAALMGWSRLTGGSDASLAYPALVAGTLGPPLLYLALRKFGYERSVSALMGAALAAAQTDIVYSGRIRTFTIDLLIVLGLAMIVPRLTRMTWRWRTAVAWFAAAMVAATFSGFALGAIAVAGAIVVLHPASDLRVRAVAVGAQAGATLALFVAEGRTYNAPAIDAQYREVWDAFPNFHLNPLHFGGEALLHLRRVAEVFPDGPSWLVMLCALAALAALVAACVRGSQTVRARFLLAVIAATFVGGLFGKVPFGPKEANPLSDGGRVSLWLVPVIAFGLAAALHGLRTLLANRRVLRVGFDTAAYLATAAILVSALTAKAIPYPFPGAKSAADFIESRLGRRDAVLIPFHANWSFAIESSFAVKMQATPDSTSSFEPEWLDRRIHYVDSLLEASHVAGAVKHANRVFVYYPEHPFHPSEEHDRTLLASSLHTLGFKQQRSVTFGDATVDILRRGGAAAQANRGPAAGHQANPRHAAARHPTNPRNAAAGHQTNRGPSVAGPSSNLRLSDFPQGWQSIPPLNPSAPPILACLHVRGAAPPSVVSYRTKTLLFAVSQLTHWPSTSGAQSASAALSGPHAARCIESASRSLALQDTAYPVSVTAKGVAPPPTRGFPAVAFSLIMRSSIGKVPVSHGTLVFLTHGRTGVLITTLAVAEHRFPSNLLSRLVATMADRVNAATR